MKKLTVLLLCTVLIVLFSCKKDSNPDSPSPVESAEMTAESANIVTGLKFKNIDGSPLWNVGNPNVKNDSIFLFPIPTKDELSVRSSTKIDEIWIMSAEKVKNQFQDMDFQTMLDEMDYDMNSLDAQQVFKANNNTSNTILDFSNYENGYYRVFIRLVPNGKVHWDNIYLDKDNDYNNAAGQLRLDWE